MTTAKDTRFIDSTVSLDDVTFTHPVQDLNGLTVLQVLPALEAGGVERGAIDVSIAIAEAGGKPLVASAGGRMVRELERAGVPHIELPLETKAPLRLRRNIGLLAEAIRKFQIDLVHARSRAPAWSARAAAKQTRRAFVTTFHGTYNFSSALKRRYNGIMTSGDRVIAISEFIADHIRAHYKIDPARLSVIHRGVDVRLFDPATVPAPRLIKLIDDWRIPDGMPVVLLPGRLTRWKGQMVLLESLLRLADRKFVAVIVGDAQGRDGYVAELKRFADQHDLHSVIRFVDHCNDMPAAYKIADVVVSASTDPEAFGRVAVEAQAMGRPVVATDHGGSRETVRPGKTGWLVPPGDADALAAALGEVLSLGEDTRAQLSTEARTHVCQNFTKELMCNRTLAVYRELTAGRGGT